MVNVDNWEMSSMANMMKNNAKNHYLYSNFYQILIINDINSQYLWSMMIHRSVS